MARSNYSAEYKAKIVLEVLQGEQELGEIAAANGLNPNMVRNWKKEFVANASRVFDESRQSKPANKKSSPKLSLTEKICRRKKGTTNRATGKCFFEKPLAYEEKEKTSVAQPSSSIKDKQLRRAYDVLDKPGYRCGCVGLRGGCAGCIHHGCDESPPAES